MTSSTSAALLVAVTLVAPSVAASELSNRDVQRASAFQVRGSQALESNDLVKAKKYFDQAVALLPFYPEAHIGLGHIAMREKRFDEALGEYRRALSGFTEASDARLHLEALRYHEAQTKIHELRDQLMNLQMGAATVKASEGNMRRSVDDLEKRIRELETIVPPSRIAAPEPPGEVHFHVGNALFRLNRLDEAVQEWELCIRKSPDFPMVYNNLAVIHWKQGRFEEAERDVAKAESLGYEVSSAFKADLARSAARQREEVERAASQQVP